MVRETIITSAFVHIPKNNSPLSRIKDCGQKSLFSYLACCAEVMNIIAFDFPKRLFFQWPSALVLDFLEPLRAPAFFVMRIGDAESLP